MAQKRKSEWHVLIGVRVIDSIWLRRSLRDEDRVAGCPHGVFSPNSYLHHWHMPVLSPICADFHTMHTHGVMKHRWLYPLPCPILGWQSTVAMAQGALDTAQRAGLFLQEQLRTPQARSPAAHHCFYPFAPHSERLGHWELPHG